MVMGKTKTKQAKLAGLWDAMRDKSQKAQKKQKMHAKLAMKYEMWDVYACWK